MTDASPARPPPQASPKKKTTKQPLQKEESEEEDEDDDVAADAAERPISTGALRRTYNRRQREHGALSRRRQQSRRNDEEDESDDEQRDGGILSTPSLVKRLNVYFNPHAPMGPAGAPVAQDLPQLLVGFVAWSLNVPVAHAILSQIRPVLLQLVCGPRHSLSRGCVHRHRTTRRRTSGQRVLARTYRRNIDLSATMGRKPLRKRASRPHTRGTVCRMAGTAQSSLDSLTRPDVFQGVHGTRSDSCGPR